MCSYPFGFTKWLKRLHILHLVKWLCRFKWFEGLDFLCHNNVFYDKNTTNDKEIEGSGNKFKNYIGQQLSFPFKLPIISPAIFNSSTTFIQNFFC